MPPTTQTTILKYANNRWLWVVLALALLLVAVLIIVSRLKKTAKPTGVTKPGSTHVPVPVPALPPISTPPYIPTNSSGTAIPPFAAPPASGIDVFSVNWTYINDLAWKTDNTCYRGEDHSCEITNGINSMGDNDLKAFMLLYKQWYNRALAYDYCNKITKSSCQGWLEADQHKKACNRLNATKI